MGSARSATTTRTAPEGARSRAVQRRPGAAASRAHTASAWPSPTSSATNDAGPSSRTNRRWNASPSGPPQNASGGSWCSSSGGSKPRARLGLGDVGRVADDGVVGPADAVDHREVHAQPQALRVGPGDVDRRGTAVGGADVQVRALVLERERHRARAGARLEHRCARRQSQGGLDQQLGLVAGDEDARVDLELEPPEDRARRTYSSGSRPARRRTPASRTSSASSSRARASWRGRGTPADRELLGRPGQQRRRGVKWEAHRRTHGAASAP